MTASDPETVHLPAAPPQRPSRHPPETERRLAERLHQAATLWCLAEAPWQREEAIHAMAGPLRDLALVAENPVYRLRMLCRDLTHPAVPDESLRLRELRLRDFLAERLVLRLFPDAVEAELIDDGAPDVAGRVAA